MKIGILTFFMPVNYGAFLQAFALSNRLNQEKGIEAEIIDFHMPEEDEHYNAEIKSSKNILSALFYRRRSKMFHDQLGYQILSEKKCCSSDINVFSSFVDEKYDVIVAGSDEIWNVDGYRGFPTPYFLPGELHCKKVSYAASGRVPFSVLPEPDRDLAKDYLNKFDYIGVRDFATYREVEKIINQRSKIHINYDPTFVYDFKPNPEKGRELLKKNFGVSGNKKVIGIMFKEGARAKPNLGKYLINRYGNEFEFVSLYDWSIFIKTCPYITPFEWIDMIAAVDGIISMYYHGVCFSIICGTTFFAIENRTLNYQESKIYDLLNRLDLTEKFALGVADAIDSENLDAFFNDVQEGIKQDSQSVLVNSRNEFDQFIEMLRQL